MISGFTRKTEENGIPVFIKNAGHDDKPGDNIELWFKLEQKDLKKLNGDSDLYLAEDTNGYDEYFEYEKTNLKHGALFIRQTDNTNTKSKVIAYTDFLAALCSPAANTKIGLFEEGDYEVALDYQVNKIGYSDFFDKSAPLKSPSFFILHHKTIEPHKYIYTLSCIHNISRLRRSYE